MTRSETPSLLKVLKGTTDFLTKHQVEQPRLNAEYLLAYVLKIQRLELYLQFERQLAESELAPLRELLRQRGKGIPLQHLLGTTEFFGRTFYCDPRALIPRPETEQLIERALTHTNVHRILDVGTGSGVIAITLALEKKNAHVEAIDLSSDALALAQKNALHHNITSITWHHGNLLEALTTGKLALEPLFKIATADEGQGAGSAQKVSVHEAVKASSTGATQPFAAAVDCEERFDLIIANLPYIATEEIPTLAREVIHDPIMALDGGSDGLKLIQHLIQQAPCHLTAEGKILLEIGKDQEDATIDLLKKSNYREIVSLPDYHGVMRFIEALKP